MKDVEQAINNAVAFITRTVGSRQRIGLILGSGLGDFADSYPAIATIPASAIPSYPTGTVSGHKGQLAFLRTGTSHGVVAFQGRIHFYESNDINAVLFPIRVARALGVETLIITNAAGGIRRSFHAGDLMVIRDQVNLTLASPVPGEIAQGSWHGSLYDPLLVDLALKTAQELSLPVQCGVYAGVKGPSYETAAEVEMLHRLGGDAVGMSTVLEVQCAAALGMNILGISCITNRATGIGSEPLDHAEVTEVAARVRERFALLLGHILEKL